MSQVSTPSSSSSSSHVPRVGGVRCYWALVTPKFPIPGMHESKLALKFVHPDPVLGAHLARQQMTMVGRDMLDFIHPNERDQARKDLGGAISTNDLQGSVTRVRFARLSRIREILGGTRDEIEYPSDAQTFVEDEEYLILDLVLNWVADGLLLAFFHAIRDKDPVNNNDPGKRNEEWTNFCGTANMPEDQLEALQTNLFNTLNSAPATNYPPTRVFQLHTTPSSPTRPDQLVFSWPPPRPPNAPHSRFDGRYDALEYADLMAGVDMDPSALQTSETKTNCTTRFGATHSLTSEGVYRVIASVYIPYGNLVFACFQTIKLVDPSPSNSPRKIRYGSLVTPPEGFQGDPMGPSPDREQEEDLTTPEWKPYLDTEYSVSPATANATTAATANDQGNANGNGHHYGHPQEQGQGQGHGYGYGPTYSHETTRPALEPDAGYAAGFRVMPRQVDDPAWDAFPPIPNPQSTHYVTPPQISRHEDEINHHGNGRPTYPPPPPPAPAPYHETPHQYSHPHPHQQHHQISPHTPSYPPPPPPPAPLSYPSLRTPTSHHHSLPYHEHQGDPPSHPISASSRPLIPPPGDVERCVSCGTRESPEWRRNESGIKDLCNACGLKLARQVAKREGKQKPRRKKDKAQSDQKSPQGPPS